MTLCTIEIIKERLSGVLLSMITQRALKYCAGENHMKDNDHTESYLIRLTVHPVDNQGVLVYVSDTPMYPQSKCGKGEPSVG